MESLISLDGVADVINNFMDKISNAVGWVATHNTPQHEAVNTFIQEIQRSNYDPLTKAALISNAKKIIHEYTNQSKIIKNAASVLKPSAHPQAIDDTWLSQFLDKARLVSDEDFQLIWGKILAEECNEPNSVPKGLLHILERMDKEGAIKFSKLCSVSVHFTDEKGLSYSPVVRHGEDSGFFDSIGLTLETLADLKALSLIDFEATSILSGSSYGISVTARDIHYFDETFYLPEGKNDFDTGYVVFTRIGKALCRAITVEKVDGFFQKYCIPLWEK